MDFDTSGLTPLDTTGLTPTGNDLDVSGLTPLDTSGLMPLDRQPAAKGPRGLDMEKVRAETPPPSSTIPVDGAAEADRAWANTPFTDRVLNPLTAGVLSLKQGVAGLGADMSARSLAVMDRVDRGETVPEMDDPVGYQQMTAEQRAAARRQAEADIGQSTGTMVQTGRRIADIPQNPAAQRMMGAKSWGDAASAFWSDPLGVIGSVGLQSLPAMAPALVAGTLGGPAAGAVAMGASSAGTEYLSSVIEGLSQEGVDVGNEQALVQAFRNPELMGRVRDRAATRAAIIGGVDGATGGLAGKTLVPARVKSTLAREVLNIPAQTVAQGAAGAGGEAGAQIATEGRITEPGQVLGEMVGEAFGAPAEVAALRNHAAAHPVEVAPPNVTPADVASPIPTDLISHGRSIVDELLAPRPAPSMEAAPNVADLPQGAVPAEVLLGQVAEPEPMAAPLAEPVRPADPVTAPAVLSVEGLTPLEPTAPLEAPAIDEAARSVAPEPMPAPTAEAPLSASEAVEKMKVAAPTLDVAGLTPLNEVAPARATAAEPDDFPGELRPSQAPSPAPTPEPAAPPPILKKDGTAFSTPQSAALAARSRPDLRGRALEPVQVDGGWGLRPVAETAAVGPEVVQPEVQAQQGVQPAVDESVQVVQEIVQPPAAPRGLGPMLSPRQTRINDAARTPAILEASIRRADETRNRPRQTAEQRGASGIAKAEILRQFDEAAASELPEWKARFNAERNARSGAVKPKDWKSGYFSPQEMEFRTGWNDALAGRPSIDPEHPDAYRKGVLDARAWMEQNPRPDGADTVNIAARTSRGQETRYSLPADADAIRAVRGNVEKLPVDRFSRVPATPDVPGETGSPAQTPEAFREPDGSISDPSPRRQSLDAKRSMPVIDVPSRFNGNRRQANMWARQNLQGAVLSNRDTGWTDILVGRAAVDKATNDNPKAGTYRADAELDALPMLPALMRDAVLVESNEHRDGKPTDYHRLYAAMRWDGALYRVKLTVKENAEGRRYWDVQSTEIEKVEPDGAKAKGRSGDDAPQQARAPGSDVNLGNLLHGVKYEGGDPVDFRVKGNEPSGPETQVGNDSLRLTPAFEQALPDIGTDLATRLQRYGIGDRIGLKLVDTIRDRDTNEPMDDAVGRYGRRVIEVALNSNSRTFTFDHEVIHGLRDLDLIRPAEWAALRRAVIQDRARMADVRARYPEFTRWGDRPEATDRLIEEGVADLFAEWQAGRAEAKGFVRTAMERIRDFLRAVGQTLRGLGFRTVDSVFRSIDRGEIGARSGEEAIAGGLAEAHHAQMQPRDEQGRFVPGAPEDRFSIERDDTAAPAPQAAEARRALMAKLAGAQPIDRVARIPFDLFGGVNARNEWKPGLYINRQAARILAEAKFADDGKLGWMNGILHRARAGLIDRYGLDAAYVERDRQRQLDERRIMAKVPELMKTLVDQDVKPEEMATLQAVLTGEEVADARWEGVAAPIRQAIDQMGAEAVELGLLSPEAFERNRGKYLHRVYAKHEADQGSLTAWVDRKMTGRRQRIVGDQFKGRGMFMEVSHGALMRNTDEAQTARERSGRLRSLEKRRDELIRRREVALARTEERHDEMEATLDRRMDTSEDAKALKRPGGATVVLKPNRYQKGQAREQGVALTRLNMKGQRARALVDRINGQLADVNGRIVDTETRLFSADDLKASKGQKFRVLDKLAETEEGKPPRVLHRAYLPEGQAIPTEMEGYQDRGVWEVRGEKGGKPVLWRDFDKGERQSMGEIVDARYTVAKTYMLMAHDLSTGRFFRDIAASPEWSRDGKDEPPSATWKEAGEYSRFWADPAIQWVKVPDTKIPKSDTKRYGALSGRFVRAEIWRDMAELESMQKPGFWDAVLRQWKANKTFRSPVVHMNNIMSNVMFMDMADVRATDLVRGTRSLLKRDAAYREALDHGAFGSDLLAQEIREEVLKPILEEIERAAQGGQGEAQARFGVVGKLADRLWSGAKAADGAMQRAYQMEDEFFRMALYLRRREQGQSPEQAALDARDTFLNYDIRAPWVNAARRSVLPFISYTYRAAPMIARTLATRPWKMAKYFTMMYALNALAYSLAPGDEDEERRSLRENEQGWAWTGVPRMMRLPTHDQHGNPVFLDMRRWIPAGDVFDTGQGQSVIPVPSWMQPGGPLAIGAELLLNRSAFTGQDIINKNTDTTAERAVKSAGYVWRQWIPSAAWMPGSWYWQSIGNAMDGARDWSGRPYSVPQAVANSVGIKIKPQDVQEGFAAWGREFEKTERELEALARRAGLDRERGLLSEVGYQRQMEGLVQKMGELENRRKETFTGSSR